MKRKILIFSLLLTLMLCLLGLFACGEGRGKGYGNAGSEDGGENQQEQSVDWSLIYTQENGKITGLTTYGRGLTKLTIPNEINGTTITSIGENVFCYITASIEWEEVSSISTIGSYAFANYEGQSLIIPNSVTSIGGNAFNGCTATISWQENQSIATIGDYAFYGYAGESLTIPNSVISIEESAFMSSNLKSIVIPESVITIKPFAFYGCESLTSISFDDKSTWYVTYSITEWQNKNGGTLINVSDSATNLYNFTIVYECDYWYKI